ncbi:MAG: BBP7 family outer membrane beta-barrel protein [Fimbriiglobus sp.]
MRNKILGSIAALATGAVSALAQGPIPAPVAIGPAGGSPAMAPVVPMQATVPAMTGPGPMVDPNAVFPGGPGPMGPMGPGGGMPGYPPGMHGQQAWEQPFNGADPAGVNGRLAPRVWLTTDYLLGFAKAQKTPYPFVTTSAPAAGGVLGNTSTLVLHSQSDLGYNLFNGVRFDGGIWRDDARRYGYYLGGFFTEEKSNVYNVNSDRTGQPLIARPYINATSGNSEVLLTSFPTYLAGGITVSSSAQLWGAEGGPIVNLYRSCPDELCLWNVNMMTGFRFLQVSEQLYVVQNSTLLGTGAFDGKLYGSGSQISVSDNFETYNRFYGGQIGLNTEMRLNNWFFSATGKIALGVMNERIDVNGTSTLAGPGLTDVSVIRGGLFANSSNSGRFNEDRFAVIPEVNVNLGYTWRSWLTTSVGYNFLYVSRVARPTDQYSPIVNPGVIPTSPAYGLGSNVQTPNLVGTQDSFWFQGVNFSLTIRY